ncbi:MAG: carboxypeptidase regulatory-like domain-containing protein [Bacteroidetes bacterium]|nr:carboxypeptidase regulatory-like domain-containing protein [Bacteroidota bacterium]
MKNVTKMLAKVMMLIAFLLLFFQEASWADRTSTWGTAASTINMPFRTAYQGARSQIVYTPTVLAGIMAGPINEIAFNVATVGSPAMTNLKISMQNHTGWIQDLLNTGWTQCLLLPSYSTVAGWNTFVLTTPFIWDGTSNIVVEVCFGLDATASTASMTNATLGPSPTAPDYEFLYNRANTDGCTQVAAYVTDYLPDVMFTQYTGTLSGTVTAAAGGLGIVGATVTGGGPLSTTIAGGAYTKDANAGTGNYIAAAAGFSPLTKSGTVTHGGTTTLNFSLLLNPAVLTGRVTNAATGLGIKGAKIVVNGKATYSIDNGLYSMNVTPAGTFPVIFSKAGYNDSTTTAVTFTDGVTTTMNMAMKEFPNPASTPFTAALNAGATQVNLNWGIPKGNYELIYDDGVPDTTTAWSFAGNMNAVKFTVLSAPVTVIGGSVNIGQPSDYAAGTTPGALTAFKVQVYDATGPGGSPGSAIGSQVSVTPTTWGWNSFTLPGISVTAGNFYLVMIQGGVPPTAARLAIDRTSSQLRSWNRYVTGGGSWLPADGNFLIRAVVNGIGGPLDNVAGLLGYQVYRLLQGQEGTPLLWTTLFAPTTTSYSDVTWQVLPDGPYRWAVKAQYTGARWSAPIFSNVIGKNWTAPVTINVALTCAADAMAGTQVRLVNNALPDTTYSGTTGADGKVTFNTVWKGDYTLTVSRIFYTTLTQTVTIMGPSTITVSPMHSKDPVTNFVVSGVTLKSSWSPPRSAVQVFNEDWSSGSYTTNGWTTDATNWVISTGTGNPAPSAEFSYSPTITNYNQYLTSKVITASPAPAHLLKYDINLSNFDATTLNTMSCEIWNGTAWKALDTIKNTGSIAWTTKVHDISAYKVSNTFKFRFHTAGVDSYAINEWYFDNIQIYGMDAMHGPNVCVLGYNFYLNDVLVGYTPDTTFNIPAPAVIYGNTYNACVSAVYGSGYSNKVCASFNDRFLCPPGNLTGVPQESTAYLTWTSPSCGPHLVNYILDSGNLGYGYSCSGAPVIEGLGNWFAIPATTAGVIQSMDVYTFAPPAMTGAITYQMDIYSPTGVLLGTSATFTPAGSLPGGSGWNTVVMPDVPFTGPFFGCFRYNITNPAWAGCAVCVDTLYSVHHNNTAGYFEATPPAPWFWQLNTAGGGKKGAFVIRVTALVNGKKELIVAGDPSPETGAPVAHPNVQAFVNTNPETAPLAPAAVPPAVLGYDIYRNGSTIPYAYVNNPATHEFYDFNLNPGKYTYTVDAHYDVSPVSPLVDNSLAVGPVTVLINYGRQLPFYEPWDNGTFTYNVWSHTGNWSVNTGLGNPAPAADFSWTPARTNYSDTLKTTAISAAPYACAKIYLDFDYKLDDRNATGAEFLAVDLFRDGGYSKIAEFANNGNVNWTSKHIELLATKGKAFKIQFRAHGAKSLDILHWYVDNIRVYAVCSPATALTYTQSHNTVNLSWTAPVCKPDGHGIHEGFEGATFPPQYFTVIKTNTETSTVNGYWWQFAGNTAIMPPVGNYYAAVWWKTTHQDEWLIAHEVSVTSNLTFMAWDYCQGSTHGDHYYCKVSTNNGSTWTVLLDLATLPPVTTTGEWKTYTVNMAAYMGQTVTLAWQAVDNGSGGIWYAWGVDQINIGTKTIYGKDLIVQSNAGNGLGSVRTDNVDVNTLVPVGKKPFTETVNAPEFAGSIVKGYNVYRTDSTAHNFHKINGAAVSGTTYTDIIPLTGLGNYKYFVTTIYNDTVANTFLCESPGSDTITVQFPHVGIVEIGNGQIMVYPNPANSNVNVKSDFVINSIDVMNYVGQTVYRNSNVNGKLTNFNVSNLNAGIYFVKVSTEQGTRTVKVTVSH